jgi:hypothetical protein
MCRRTPRPLHSACHRRLAAQARRYHDFPVRFRRPVGITRGVGANRAPGPESWTADSSGNPWPGPGTVSQLGIRSMTPQATVMTIQLGIGPWPSTSEVTIRTTTVFCVLPIRPSLTLRISCELIAMISGDVAPLPNQTPVATIPPLPASAANGQDRMKRRWQPHCPPQDPS